MQTGAQLTAGFLLTLPFQAAFADLDDFDTALYLVLVLLSALTTALVLTPVAIHRRLVRSPHQGPPGRCRRTGSCTPCSLCLALLMTGIVLLVFDLVVDRTSAVVGRGGDCASCSRS